MRKTALREAMEEFRQIQKAHARDMYDLELAESLRLARLRLEQEAAKVLQGLPFRVMPVTQDRHFAVREQVELREGRRYRGQTLCGAASGRPPFGSPAPCLDCLRVAEHYLREGPPPLELELGL